MCVLILNELVALTKNIKQKISTLFSSTALFLMLLQTFMPLGMLLLTPSTVSAVSDTTTHLELPFSSVLLDFNDKNEFELEVKSDVDVPYTIVYSAEEIESAVTGVAKSNAGKATSTSLAGTCSNDVCTADVVKSGSLLLSASGQSFKFTVTDKVLWLNSGKSASLTSVEMGKTYVAPQNDEVTVTFTKLPENAGSLSIEEVTLSDEQVAALGAVSNIAYDITSDMENGSFEYTLKLPVPAGTEKSTVVYADSLAQLSSESMSVNADKVQVNNNSSSLTVSELNHFTVFVVVNPATQGDCDAVAVGSSAGTTCFDNLDSAIGAASSGDTLAVYSDLTTTSQVNINKSLIIEGNGHTISPNFTKTGNDNNAVIGIINQINVTVKNMTIDGTLGINLHGINLYESTNALLDNLTIINNDRYGVVLNASSATAHDIATSGNGWGGINVDKGTITNPASLIVTGESNHSDALHIVIDNAVNTYNTFDDTAPQYTPSNLASQEIYQLAPTTSICSVTTSVFSTDLATWDLSDTRSTGHNQISPTGLHIWTEGSTSTDKAAGYYPTDFPLVNTGSQTIAEAIDYQASFGISPGLQLKVDFDNDGDQDGILVGEAIYGNSWWLANSSDQFVKDNAPHVGGGSGSNWHGTVNGWIARFPNARVKAIGYSLGSGVYADGILKRISLGCTNYTFGVIPDTAKPTVSNITITPTINGNIGRSVIVQFDINDASAIDLSKTRVLFADGPNEPNRAKESAKFTPILISGNTYKVEIDTTAFIKQNFIGNYNLNFNLWDVHGNQGSTKPVAFRPILIDNSGPFAVLTNPPTGSTINGIERVVFTIIDDTSVSGGYAKFNGPTPKQLNLVHEGGDLWYVDLDTSTMSDGTYTVDIRPTDGFGTARYNANRGTLHIDNTAPAAPQILFPNPEQNFTTTPILNDWTDVSDASGIKEYRVEYVYDDGHSFSAGPYRIVTASQRNHAPSAAEQGGVKIRVQAFDTAGNEGNWSDWRHYYYDTSPPSTPVIGGFINPSLSCGVITSLHNITTDWSDSVDDESGIAGYEYEVTYPLPAGGFGVWNSFFTNSQYGGSLNEGLHTVRVRARNNAGQVSGWSNNCTVTADWSAPDTEITAPADNATVSGTIEFRGSVNDNNLMKYFYRIYNASDVTVASATVNYVLSFTNKLIYTWDTTLVEDGEYYLRLEAEDSANNIDTGSTDVIKVNVLNTVTPTPTPTPGPQVLGASTSSSDSDNKSSGSDGKAAVCSAEKPKGAPSVSAAIGGPNSVTLSWNAVSPATHYAVSFTRLSDGQEYGASNVGNVTSYTVNNLDPATTYSFEVFAVNDCAPGDRSSSVNSGTITGGPVVGGPEGPAGEVLGDQTDETEDLGNSSEENTSDSKDENGSAPGAVLGLSDELCENEATPYMPIIFLLGMILIALAIEFLLRGPSFMKLALLGVLLAAGIGVFYYIRNCNCGAGSTQTTDILTFICTWFWGFAAVQAAVLRGVGYLFIQDND